MTFISTCATNGMCGSYEAEAFSYMGEIASILVVFGYGLYRVAKLYQASRREDRNALQNSQVNLTPAIQTLRSQVKAQAAFVNGPRGQVAVQAALANRQVAHLQDPVNTPPAHLHGAIQDALDTEMEANPTAFVPEEECDEALKQLQEHSPHAFYRATDALICLKNEEGNHLTPIEINYIFLEALGSHPAR